MSKSILSGVKFLVISILIFGCSDDGQVIEAKGRDFSTTGIFTGNKSAESSDSAFLKSDSYKVKALEVLQTPKYSYLKVEGEGDGLSVGEPYWIATLKNDFIVGEEYIYTGRLLKKDFESKEFNRIFDKIYLVSFIDNANGLTSIKSTIEGVVTIADIVSDPMGFTGKKVKVHGQVVKVNDAIMDRNWIHLVDGSADDYDFVITSDVSVPVGHTVAFEGFISTNRDFGAGYRYELLMEDAVTIK
ncbi:MAG: hypothetical protein HOM41_06070 [Flavobacteriales bacterium]|jgi:hypothetical protein|nr:hypothetical protein [Flavobacteriales bacterium]MBT6173992.1 hypothetical protein [Flavobacteriales bacterium]